METSTVNTEHTLHGQAESPEGKSISYSFQVPKHIFLSTTQQTEQREKHTQKQQKKQTKKTSNTESGKIIFLL